MCGKCGGCSGCQGSRVGGVTLAAVPGLTRAKLDKRVTRLDESLRAIGADDSEWRSWVAGYRRDPATPARLTMAAESLAQHAERLGGALTGRVRVAGAVAVGAIADEDVPEGVREAERALGGLVNSIAPALGPYGGIIKGVHDARLGAMYGDAEWLGGSRGSQGSQGSQGRPAGRTYPGRVVVAPAGTSREGKGKGRARASKGTSRDVDARSPSRRSRRRRASTLDRLYEREGQS